MKRFKILALLFLMVGSLSISAQTTLGGRAGVNIGLASVDGLANIITPDIQPLNTFTGGITINHRLDERLSVTSGIHYKRKGFIVEEMVGVDVFGVDIPVGGSLQTSLDYLEVPLLLNLAFNRDSKVQPYLEFGPAFSYAIQGELQPRAQVIIEINLPTIDLDLTKDIYNRFEVAGQAVGGIKIPYGAGEFDLGVSYTHAFTDMLKDPALNVEIRNFGIGIHAGFAMPLGSTEPR